MHVLVQQETGKSAYAFKIDRTIWRKGCHGWCIDASYPCAIAGCVKRDVRCVQTSWNSGGDLIHGSFHPSICQIGWARTLLVRIGKILLKPKIRSNGSI